MSIEEFSDWLMVLEKYKDNTVRTYKSDVKKLEKDCGDLKEHFLNDGMQSIIQSLNYSPEDKKNSRPHTSKLKISNTESIDRYKKPASLYARFLSEEYFGKDVISEINKAEERLPSGGTERDTLIKARLGQGVYRENLLKKWRGRCSVTGFNNTELLRASHVKAWKFSSNNERIDPENGLLLIPNLDLAFDKGLITFDDNGVIQFSDDLPARQRSAFGLVETMRIFEISPKLKKYLTYHRMAQFRSKPGRVIPILTDQNP